MHGIGDLAVYDTALRIGWSIGLKPDELFLQAGARKGARRLEAKQLLRIPRGDRSVQVSLFPPEMQALVPYQIETFLCVSCGDL